MKKAAWLAVPMLVHFAKYCQVLATLVLWVTSQLFSRGSCSHLWQDAEFTSMSPAVLQSSCFISLDYTGVLAPAVMPTSQLQAHQESNQASEHRRRSTNLLWLTAAWSPHLPSFLRLLVQVMLLTPEQPWGTNAKSSCVFHISRDASWLDKELATRPNGPYPNQISTYSLESLPFKVFSCITVWQENEWVNGERQTVEAPITKVYFWYS